MIFFCIKLSSILILSLPSSFYYVISNWVSVKLSPSGMGKSLRLSLVCCPSHISLAIGLVCDIYRCDVHVLRRHDIIFSIFDFLPGMPPVRLLRPTYLESFFGEQCFRTTAPVHSMPALVSSSRMLSPKSSRGLGFMEFKTVVRSVL